MHNAYLTPCGCFIIIGHRRNYIPLLGVHAHTVIRATTSRTTLTQTFANPSQIDAIEKLNYVFPLYDGVSVVAFTITVGARVIHGVVKERQKAKQVYDEAVAAGQTAGLLTQSLENADVFTTSVGNVPAGEKIKVELTYLGELKHDAEIDGLRFTIPTKIAPRYGQHESWNPYTSTSVTESGGLSVTIDADMPDGFAVKSIQSPTHPISVSVGSSSTSSPSDQPSLQKASASLALDTAELTQDFVIQVAVTRLGEPSAILEHHSTIPNQRALMTTLVPKFSLPSEKPEIVFVCDRSGSMSGGKKMPNLISALQTFLKSLPVGVKFNICSFGSRCSFLWPRSKTYAQDTLAEAVKHLGSFGANMGGTEMYQPIEKTFEQRYKDMNLEVFLLTDGEITAQNQLFELINKNVSESKGAIRLFTLGIGRHASHALIEGAARAGNGFAQTVGDNERMDKKVVRMLKASLSPHVNDYTLEIKYGSAEPSDVDSDDFEIVEKVMDALDITGLEEPANDVEPEKSSNPISLYDPKANPDADQDTEMVDADLGKKYDHLPAVPAPRYLQAPFKMPPLFPFNRSTVYVLFSDESPSRPPRSVLLKGTSRHGPLELEIPITTLSEKGTTIHQLAARKAVNELEEGRGWMPHAKDAKTGKLLKDQYDGRFSDMVEREAVRLGVQYQIVGKWCSFVAVEQGKEDDAVGKGAPEASVDDNLGYNPAFELQGESFRRARRSMPSGDGDVNVPTVAACFGRSARSARSARISDTRSDTRGDVSLPAMSQPRLSGAGGGGLFCSAAPSLQAQQTSGGLFGSASPPAPAPAQTSGGLFGSASAPAPAQTSGVFLGSASPPAASSAFPGNVSVPSMGAARSYGSPSGARQPSGQLFPTSNPSSTRFDDNPGEELESCSLKLENTTDQTYSLQKLRTQRTRLTNMSSAKTGSFTDADAPAGKAKDPLQVITELQAFGGNWAWSQVLEDVLGVSLNQAREMAHAEGLAEEAATDDILATVCTALYLRRKLADEVDVWDMMVDKAEQWLADQLGGENETQKWLRALEGLF